MKLPVLHTADELISLINEIGFLPLFKSAIDGFSVEDITPEELWFHEGVIGPWEWREDIADSGKAAYAKLFQGKAGFVSLEMYPHFCNFRRDGYDFDARLDEGLVPDREKRLYRIIEGGLNKTGDIKKAYGDKGYDAALNRLEMRTYVTISRFYQRVDKHGRPYGWKIGEYTTSEARFGDLCSRAYDFDPNESYKILAERLHRFFPECDPASVLRY